ncbi:MAG TPA: sensor histidine kinase, partial [Alphaproteobacteria bacterium]|nr:sensor histidine kinase [Alphaproteobacteria bacterium]
MNLQLLLIVLLVKAAVSAALASALGRSKEFKKLLFREKRSLRDTVFLVLFTCLPLAIGVYIRCSVHWLPADLGFEASILIGVVGGRRAGAMGGALMAAPAMFYGEYLTLPVNIIAGVVAGVLRHFSRNEEEMWTFSPFIDLSIYRWVKRHIRDPRVDWQTAFFLVIIALQAGRIELKYAMDKSLFVLYQPTFVGMLAVFSFVIATISIPIKIWNNARIEMKLEEQEKLLLEA